MIYDRKTFLDAVRPHMAGGKLTTQQVTGLEAKLSVWEEYHSDQPDEFLAGCLAQSKWETGGKLYPVVEAFNLSGEARIDYLTNLYDVNGSNPTRAKQMGNVHPGDGVKYCGQGDIQLTWFVNYEKLGKLLGVDLVGHPELARDPIVSARIMFEGMLRGLFRTHKLADYWKNGVFDAYNSRDIVNGDKTKIPKGSTKSIGSIIAADYAMFAAALRAARAAAKNPVQPVEPVAVATIQPAGTSVMGIAMPSSNFIGNLISGIAQQAVATVANDPAIPHLTPEAIPSVSAAIDAVAKASPQLKQVSDAVAQAVTPVPWYKSSVLNGVIVAAICSYVSSKFGVTVPDEWRPLFETIVGQFGVAAGLGIAAVGRIASKAHPVTLRQK